MPLLGRRKKPQTISRPGPDITVTRSSRKATSSGSAPGRAVPASKPQVIARRGRPDITVSKSSAPVKRAMPPKSQGPANASPRSRHNRPAPTPTTDRGFPGETMKIFRPSRKLIGGRKRI